MKKTGTGRRALEAASIGQDLMLAPLVVAMRLPMMAAEVRNGRAWSAETSRALSEKTGAMVEGALAAQMALLQSASRFWPEVLSGRTPSLFNGIAAERLVSAALKPASRTVKANFHRLSTKS